MVFMRLPTSLSLFFCVAVSSLSIPATQQLAQNNASLALTSSASLGAPTPIPGFETRLQFDLNPSLTLTEVYNNAIFVIYKILKGSKDEYFERYFYYWGFQFHEEIYISSVSLRRGPTLQYKHAIQAVYEAGTALARIPITTPNHVPKLLARLYFRNQLIGLMKWQHKSNAASSEANATLSLLDTANPTASLQSVPMNERVGFGPPYRVVKDETDPRYLLMYQVWEQDVPLSESFSAILEAMAAAAQKPQDAVGDAAHGVGVGGSVAVDVHGTRAPNTLTWSDINRALFLLWCEIVAHGLLKKITFHLFFAGPELAGGEISSTANAGSGMVSSS